jgi:hypothetical protein
VRRLKIVRSTTITELARRHGLAALVHVSMMAPSSNKCRRPAGHSVAIGAYSVVP